ncbi:MAG TPA: 23S rRNA (guanosine(2251)-2'-O)-methyltransferase RlmB [Syntrophomonadaceae bacterium]|nr:23S rRNA (guanosine(2251)-2'-O)-methyltransferase RlmB [Syntrophomonadaceae bacterium]HRX21197.1 23S rRNA (guanosine(2251)-2'-O)-methyltransferase RlmB [Syntrophomonadaceae bacterium]
MTEKIAGVNSIMEALKGQRKVHKIFIQEGRQGNKIEELVTYARKKGVFVQYLEKSRLDAMYTASNHQGVVAQISAFDYSEIGEVLEKACLEKHEPFILILDGIEDPQNFGSIIRTAEAAGVHGIVIPKHNSTEVTAAVARASAGAVEHILIIRETNLVNTINFLKQQGFWIIGADMQGEKEYFNTVIPAPTALVIGGEGRGIRRLVRENCDLLLNIPMTGKIGSLNASVSAALLIYEVVRQRNTRPGNK